MEPDELLGLVALACETLGIPYFITGSTATIAYGEPRFTNDIDTVVELPASKAQALCEMFDRDEFYLSETAVLSAIKHHSKFNLIHPGSGLKVDFMVAAESDFNRSRMSRARDLPVLEGRTVKFASPEDAILMKLKYYLEGQAEKPIRDILSVLKIQNERIDYQYLDHWANRLAVTTEWKFVLKGMKDYATPDGSMQKSIRLSKNKGVDRATQLRFKHHPFDLVHLLAQLFDPSVDPNWATEYRKQVSQRGPAIDFPDATNHAWLRWEAPSKGRLRFQIDAQSACVVALSDECFEHMQLGFRDKPATLEVEANQSVVIGIAAVPD